jgi:hypothetical protein
MFELNIHAVVELLWVLAAPVDADRVADAPSLFSRGSRGLSHVSLLIACRLV